MVQTHLKDHRKRNNLSKKEIVQVTLTPDQKIYKCVEDLFISGVSPDYRSCYTITKIEIIGNRNLSSQWKAGLETLLTNTPKTKPYRFIPEETRTFPLKPSMVKRLETLIDNIGDLKSRKCPPEDEPRVCIVPLWHGTKKQFVQPIIEGGLRVLGTTDPGFLGSGLYGTPQAEYATRVYSLSPEPERHLFLCLGYFDRVWPIDGSDRVQSFRPPFQCHYAPVKPKSSTFAEERNYHPISTPTDEISYDEVCFSQANHLMPVCHVVVDFDKERYLQLFQQYRNKFDL